MFSRPLLTLSTTIALTFATFTNAHPAEDRYKLDNSHTNILFFIDHIGFSKMVGEFHDYDAVLFLDEQQPEKSSINITIKTASIDTDHDGLNQKLQGKDFFRSDEFPTAKFVSKSVKRTSDKEAIVSGDFTLLGVTKPLDLKVTFNRAGVHPYSQDYVAGFTATGTLKRSDFGMNWGIPMVGDEVKLHIEAEAIRILQAKK